MAVKRYNGTSWDTVAGLGAQGAAAISSSITTWVKTASGGETSLTGSSDSSTTLAYTPGQEQFFINGVLQVRGSDYTATNGTSITGITALVAGDIATVTTVNAFSVANTYTIAEADNKFFQTANAFLAGKNAVINGGFDVWQRGTSVAVAASTIAYTADRLSILTAASQASTVSRQATNDTTNLPNIQYCARVQRNSGQTGTGTMYVANSIETINSIPFSGKAVTVSFYARAGANYSATSNALNLYLWNGTGTDQNVNAGYTNPNMVGSVTATLTTTWQRFTFTGTVPTNSTELALQFQNVPTGTAGANDYYEVTGIQLELGLVATAFSRTGGTIQGELAACQRYYYRMTADKSLTVFGKGFASSTTVARIGMPFATNMRVSPTAVEWTGLSLQDYGSTWTVTDLSVGTDSSYSSRYWATGSAIVSSGLTQFRPFDLIANNTSSYIGWSAEL